VLLHVCNNQQLLVCVAMCYRPTLIAGDYRPILGVQRDMVNFAWGRVARSIGVSRYTATYS